MYQLYQRFNMGVDELRPLVISILQEEAKRRNAELNKVQNQTLIILTIIFALALVVRYYNI